VLTSGALLASRVTSVAAQSSLDKFMIPSPPCRDETVTPAVAAAGSDFIPNSPSRPSLVERGMAGPTMTLSGFVIGLKCGRIKDARVEIWHAGSKGIYEAPFRHRGQQRTNVEGQYRFETVLPGVPSGRARHVNVRVTPQGAPSLTTVLYFPDTPGNDLDPLFKPELVMKPALGGGVRAFAFDFVFDL
jgi:protocatechuate 3,4-dioxygenase beta subunit